MSVLTKNNMSIPKRVSKVVSKIGLNKSRSEYSRNNISKQYP